VRPWNAASCARNSGTASFDPEGHGCLRCRAIAYKTRTALLQKIPAVSNPDLEKR